ncbi:MAG: FG-GAP repeat protein, partial [Flavisolibacter sp.]|nr:FG-GAP repeat protein [Flavisolibacter sp.]
HASEAYPLQLYVGDIDNNGSPDQILAVEKDEKYYPFLGKEELEKILPAVIKKRYLDYKSMAGRTVEEIIGNKLSRLKKLTAATLASVIIKNNKGHLQISALPSPVQWSPVFSFLAADFNKDGKTDIITGGNFYGVTPYEGRYDAGYGNVLIRGDCCWDALLPLQSGLVLDGEVRDMKKLKTSGNKTLFLVARNNNTLLFYRTSDHI